jgi:hypothetical protein
VPGQMKAVDIVIGSTELMAEHPELFHYTRRPAFEAILGSNTLWATHFRDLDDKNEIATLKPLLLRSLADIFDAEVKTRAAPSGTGTWHHGGSIPHAERFIASLYGATFDKNKPRFAVDAFTTSFTTHVADSDLERSNGLPSQWKRYAPDGFCIVLDTAAMCGLLGSEFDTRDYTHLNLERARYAFDHVPLRDHFDDVEPALRSAVDQFFKDYPNPEMGTVEFLRSATLLKKPCFKEERELRIVAIPTRLSGAGREGTYRLRSEATADYRSKSKAPHRHLSGCWYQVADQACDCRSFDAAGG